MYMLQKWVIVDVVLLMNTSMHVGIMEQGVGTEEAAKGRGVAPSHKKKSAATPPLSRQKDGMILVPTLLALHAEAAQRQRRVNALPALQGAEATASCTCIATCEPGAGITIAIGPAASGGAGRVRKGTAGEEARVGAAWRRRARTTIRSDSASVASEEDGKTLCRCQRNILALRAGAATAPATRQRPACVPRRGGGAIALHVHPPHAPRAVEPGPERNHL